MWQLAGTLTGLAIRVVWDAHQIKQAQELPRRPRDKSAFRSVAPPLPAAAGVYTPGFSFGIPFGWIEGSHAQRMEQQKDMNNAQLVTAVGAQRPDGMGPPIVVHAARFEDDRIIDYPEMFAERHRESGIQPFAGPWAIQIGGMDAILLHYKSVSTWITEQDSRTLPTIMTEAVVFYRQWVYQIIMISPAITHEYYLPSYFTVLGTWSWR